MVMRRSILLSLTTATALVALVDMARANDPGCPAGNALEALKTSDPTAHMRVRKSADAAVNSKNVLWKIEQPEYPDRAASYIFGTLGISDPRLEGLSEKTEEALSLSRRMAFEVEDLTTERTVEAVGVMTNAMANGAAAKYEQALGKPDMARVQLLLTRSSMPKEWLPRIKPWVAMIAVSQSDCEGRRLKAGKVTQDSELARMAEDRGVGSFGLESAEHKFSVFANMPEPDQIALLKARMKNYDRLDERTEAVVQLYKKRDLGAIWPLQSELDRAGGLSEAASEALRQGLIDNRNVHMRDRLAMHLAYGGVFVTVNAIQIPGKSGLIELLKDAGYTLTPIE